MKITRRKMLAVTDIDLGTLASRTTVFAAEGMIWSLVMAENFRMLLFELPKGFLTRYL